MTGITRSAAARIIAGHFHSSAVHVGGTYDTYTVEDNTGRKWKVVSDASIKCQSRGERTASRLYAVEMVTPICKYEDIETIQQLVRELRRGGARVNDSCGIHIHVDASRHDPKTLRNIVNIMASKEDLLYKALNVQIDRECYCQKADLRFLEDVNLKHPKSMAEFETLWYNGDSRRNVHYDYSRYHALNLHSVFSKGTVEFRMPAMIWDECTCLGLAVTRMRKKHRLGSGMRWKPSRKQNRRLKRKEDLKHIFERLYKCDKGRSEKGSGLGLSIVHQLVEKMGGSITVESFPGKGTEFVLRFPLEI